MTEVLQGLGIVLLSIAIWWSLDYIWRSRVVTPRRQYRGNMKGYPDWRLPGESRVEYQERMLKVGGFLREQEMVAEADKAGRQ